MKVRISRGRKVTANYQSHEVSVEIESVIANPVNRANPDAEPTADDVHEHIRAEMVPLWEVVEAELAAKVAEIEQSVQASAPAPQGPPPAQQPPANYQGGQGGYQQQQPPQGGYQSGYQSQGGGQGGGQRRGQIPTSGRQLYPWLKTLEEQQGPGLVKFVTEWGKRQGWSYKLSEWDPQQTGMAVAEVQRRMASPQAPGPQGPPQQSWQGGYQPQGGGGYQQNGNLY